MIILKNVLVIFGGASSEYEVSLRSSASVLRNIDREKYNVYTLGITKDGRWLFYEGDIDSIENNSWIEKNTVSAIISPDKSEKALLVFKGEKIEKINSLKSSGKFGLYSSYFSIFRTPSLLP